MPEEVRRAVPEAPLWIGSGVDLASLPSWRSLAHGAIIGTALHRDGQVSQPLDVERVRAFAAGM